MATISSGMLLILLIAAVITTIAMLSVFSNIIEHETQLHDLRNRVKELHYQQAVYLARVNGRIGEEGEVEMLDDDAESAQDTAELDTNPQRPYEYEPSQNNPSAVRDAA